MTRYIARDPNNRLTVTSEDVPSEIVQLHNLGYTFYRIKPNQNGTFTLIPQRALNPVTEEKVVSTELEDDV